MTDLVSTIDDLPQSSFEVDTNEPKTKAVRLVIRAMLLNVLNPKLTIFFLAFLPQFIHPGSSSPLAQLLLLSLVFMAMTFAVLTEKGDRLILSPKR